MPRVRLARHDTLITGAAQRGHEVAPQQAPTFTCGGLYDVCWPGCTMSDAAGEAQSVCASARSWWDCRLAAARRTARRAVFARCVLRGRLTTTASGPSKCVVLTERVALRTHHALVRRAREFASYRLLIGCATSECRDSAKVYLVAFARLSRLLPQPRVEP